jgi:DNA-binding MarR family transcriptional regulator
MHQTTQPPSSAERIIRSPESPEHDAFLNLVVTYRQLVQEVADIVKAHGLTEPQFNALRILRGAGRKGLPCNGIAESMLTRVPDITRLVDRLERQKLAVRRHDVATDRRVVRVAITRQGRSLLRKLDEPVRETHRKQFDRLSRTELREFIRILKKTRSR